jgi:hypothetical protein
MAKIIKFPERLELPHDILNESGIRYRCLQALRFLFNSIRAGTRPSKMMVIYEGTDENKTIYYLNLGYRAGELTTAVLQVQRDMVEKKVEPLFNPQKN